MFHLIIKSFNVFHDYSCHYKLWYISRLGSATCTCAAKSLLHTLFFTETSRPRTYKTSFVLNSAEHGISKLDKFNLINLLEKPLTCGDLHCFCLSNQNFDLIFHTVLRINYALIFYSF